VPRNISVSIGGKAAQGVAASPSQMGRFETRWLTAERNLCVVDLRPGALLVSADLFLLSRYKQIVTLAALHALPAMCPWREFAAAGSLMSYGPSLSDAYHRQAIYVGKILQGAKPADLPVEQSTIIELIINLKTAKTLGLALPITLAGRADEVIE
jgi:putative tryptophan/tyrosine transport system substrate-binding protein